MYFDINCVNVRQLCVCRHQATICPVIMHAGLLGRGGILVASQRPCSAAKGIPKAATGAHSHASRGDSTA